jgi:NAD(P)-dependent dehydrogenase (short-subunit alcohol dehydrogenase family)
VDVSSEFDVAGFGVIVTGGASGLGLAYGEVLAAHGARVTLIDVDAARVAEQAARLQADGLDVRSAVADVTDHPALDRAIDEAAECRGLTSRSRTPHCPGSSGRRRLGEVAGGRGGRARVTSASAEPRDRDQPERDLRDRAAVVGYAPAAGRCVTMSLRRPVSW